MFCWGFFPVAYSLQALHHFIYKQLIFILVTQGVPIRHLLSSAHSGNKKLSGASRPRSARVATHKGADTQGRQKPAGHRQTKKKCIKNRKHIVYPRSQD